MKLDKVMSVMQLPVLNKSNSNIGRRIEECLYAFSHQSLILLFFFLMAYVKVNL